MKKTPEGSSKNRSPEEIAETEKSKIKSETEPLTKGGVEYEVDEDVRKNLRLTKEEITKIRLIKDKYTILSLIKQNSWILSIVSSEFRADKDVVLEAVKQDKRVFRFASQELQTDKEVRKAAGLE